MVTCIVKYADLIMRRIYGAHGEGFIEAHHETPLAERNIEEETRIEDLRMVCANCHRMLHRRYTLIVSAWKNFTRSYQDTGRSLKRLTDR